MNSLPKHITLGDLEVWEVITYITTKLSHQKCMVRLAITLPHHLTPLQWRKIPARLSPWSNPHQLMPVTQTQHTSDSERIL